MDSAIKTGPDVYYSEYDSRRRWAGGPTKGCGGVGAVMVEINGSPINDCDDHTVFTVYLPFREEENGVTRYKHSSWSALPSNLAWKYSPQVRLRSMVLSVADICM